MKRTHWLLPLVLAAACSARGSGGGGVITDDDADTTDTASPDVATDDVPTTEDTPTTDAPITPDVMIGDVPVTPDVVVKPDVPVTPDSTAGRCARDSECTGSTWCDMASGMCMPIVCTPGRVSCVSTTRARTCDSRGSSFTEMDCAGGCVGGVCMGGSSCTAPMAMCSGACVNTQTDSANCGACGRACTAGQTCVSGVCNSSVTCTSPTTNCSGVCVNLLTSATNCGTCGRACTTGQTCVSGVCTTSTTCTSPTTNCAGVCVNLQTDATNCGACGRACATGQTCVSGVCSTMACAPPTTRCGALCIDISSDPNNCGRCGTICPAGQTCSESACVPLGTGSAFQIMSLGTTGCSVIDHNSATSDDRGGIAVGASSVFYTGDTSTARFDPETLTPTAVGHVYDGLLSNLRTGVVYSLATAAGPHLNTPSGATFTSLVELDPLTGLATTRTLSLSTPLTLASDTGIFSGWDRAVFASAGRVYNVDLTSGRVTDLGTMVFPTHQICENWAFWGVAELIGGVVHLAYVESPTRIARVRVPDATVTTVGTFTSLSDMCSFSVSPTRNRWYFHHEYSSQFGGSGETVGRCPAVLSAGGPTTCPTGQTMCASGCADLTADATNCGTCGRACTTGQACVAGVCSTPTLLPNYTRTTPPSTVTFTDVCSMAGADHVLTSIDDSQVSATTPFAFPFWGTVLPMGRTVNIASNGFISLDGMAISYTATLQSTAAPNGVISAWGTDIITSATGVCYATLGTAPTRRWVVEWSAARPYGSSATGTITTELVVNEDGPIDILTSSNTSSVTTALVGVENMDGTRGVSGCTATTGICANPTGNRVRFAPSP